MNDRASSDPWAPGLWAPGLGPASALELVSALNELNQKLLVGLAGANRALAERYAKLAEEWGAFLQRRLGEDISTAQKLVQCSSGTEIYGLYADFWQNLVAQYQEEFAKLGAVWRNSAEDAEASAEPAGLSLPVPADRTVREEDACCGAGCTSPCRDRGQLPEAARSQHH